MHISCQDLTLQTMSQSIRFLYINKSSKMILSTSGFIYGLFISHSSPGCTSWPVCICCLHDQQGASGSHIFFFLSLRDMTSDFSLEQRATKGKNPVTNPIISANSLLPPAALLYLLLISAIPRYLLTRICHGSEETPPRTTSAADQRPCRKRLSARAQFSRTTVSTRDLANHGMPERGLSWGEERGR